MKTTAPLSDYRNRHAGEDVVVCGCGTSLRTLADPQRCITIGVNDVGRLFDPTYLVVVNPPSQLQNGRFQYVEGSNARALFTHLDLGPVKPPVVQVRLGRYGGTDVGAADVLHYTQNSPYVAACLAAYMGARRIGLIGVDLTDDHFFARTGRHSLSGRLRDIDAEYGRLAESLARQGVELLNLSATSRLTTLKRIAPEAFTASDRAVVSVATAPRRRVFFVDYRFLACGDVFASGLAHAAETIGVDHESAWWDDPDLPARIARFRPDLVFVVHGRRAVQRWPGLFKKWWSAVWLLDEPYEVDETSRWSGQFDTVFVNDASTIGRHRNAHELATCFDPVLHHDPARTRDHLVGFVGGHNDVRERYLLRLADEGLLSYVVGGPWKARALQALRVSERATPAETAALYQRTQIVVNVFRSLHHFNGRRVEGRALNPRVFEALACGALVVSEPRPALASLFPDVPTFTSEDELVGTLRGLLQDAARAEAIRESCRARLGDHDYAARLRRVLEVAFAPSEAAVHGRTTTMTSTPIETMCHTAAERAASEGPAFDPDAWELCAPVERTDDEGVVVLRKASDGGPGSERGLASRSAHEDVELSFDVWVAPGASFIAKLHQADRLDQTTNSYHLFCDGTQAYLARHNHVLRRVDVARGRWQRLRLTWTGGVLSLHRD